MLVGTENAENAWQKMKKYEQRLTVHTILQLQISGCDLQMKSTVVYFTEN